MIVLRTESGAPIRWQCSVCGDTGVISNREDSPFDLRRQGLRVAEPANDIVIPNEIAAALRDLHLLDPKDQGAPAPVTAAGAQLVVTVAGFGGERVDAVPKARADVKCRAGSGQAHDQARVNISARPVTQFSTRLEPSMRRSAVTVSSGS